MIKELLANMNYQLNIIIFSIRFNLFSKQMVKTRHNMKRLSIFFRLRKKGTERDKVENICERYFGYQIYLQKKESKEAYRELMDFISEWSKTSGIPQWEAREILNRDFHLDV